VRFLPLPDGRALGEELSGDVLRWLAAAELTACGLPAPEVAVPAWQAPPAALTPQDEFFPTAAHFVDDVSAESFVFFNAIGRRCLPAGESDPTTVQRIIRRQAKRVRKWCCGLAQRVLKLSATDGQSAGR
jgi:hypothetical protein